jgi:hypothetical protein
LKPPSRSAEALQKIERDYARLHGSAERILQKGGDPGSIVREVLGALGAARPAVAKT